jgi:hypothetical protein
MDIDNISNYSIEEEVELDINQDNTIPVPVTGKPMDIRTKQVLVSESFAKYDLQRFGYFVYDDTCGKSPHDFIAEDPLSGKLFKISVKSVIAKNTPNLNKRKNNYSVGISDKRPNTSGTKVIPFNPDSCDVVAATLLSKDCNYVVAIAYIPSNRIKNKNSITIQMEKEATKTTFDVKKHKDPRKVLI